MKKLVTICLLLTCLQLLHAQSPFIEWSKSYGADAGDYLNSIKVTADGGFIAVGQVEKGGGDIKGFHGTPLSQDIWVIKLNSTGVLEWQKCLNGDYTDMGNDILQTADGGYVVLGTSASVNCDAPDNRGNRYSLDILLIKLSATGEVEWQKKLGGSKNEYAVSLDMAADGGYIIGGYSESSDFDLTVNKGEFDYWVLKVDGRGNLIWQNSGGGSGTDQALSVKGTPDGGAIATGSEWSKDGDFTNNFGYTDAWVAKYDKNGVLQWRKNYGSSGGDAGNSIQCTPDGGYIMAGSAGNPDHDVISIHGPPSADYWLVKLNPDGSIAWQKTYGGSKNENASNVQLTPDGGYILAGGAESNDGDLSCNAGITDVWVVKVDGAGNLQWSKSMGGNYYEERAYIIPVNSSEYIVGAHTCSDNVTGHHPISSNLYTCADLWVFKLSAPLATTPKPQVIINPSSGGICPGANNTLTASVFNAGETYTIDWKKNGVSAGTGLTCTAPDFKAGDVISCTITTGGVCNVTSGAQATSSITLTSKKNRVTPAISITANNTALCGCTKVLAATTVSNAGPGSVYS